LLSDIDGTLLDDGGELPALNRNALEASRREGVFVALATGRRWSTTKRLLERLDLAPLVDYAIMNNGMVVKDLRRDAVLQAHAFPLSTVIQVIERWNSLGYEPIVLSHSRNGLEPDIFYRTLSLMNGDFIEKNPGQGRLIDGVENIMGLDLVELLLLGPHPELLHAEKSLFGLPVETALIKNSFYREWMLEITPLGISKLSGALFLQEKLGVGKQGTMAIGDSANDLPLLEAAGHAVAMAHAPEGLKARAHAVAGDNPSGSMGQAVMAWLENGLRV